VGPVKKTGCGDKGWDYKLASQTEWRDCRLSSPWGLPPIVTRQASHSNNSADAVVEPPGSPDILPPGICPVLPAVW